MMINKKKTVYRQGIRRRYLSILLRVSYLLNSWMTSREEFKKQNKRYYTLNNIYTVTMIVILGVTKDVRYTGNIFLSCQLIFIN